MAHSNEGTGTSSPDVFFSAPNVTIIHNDLFRTKSIEPNSIDLIVTSPPYNVDMPYHSHHDGLEYQQYLDFSTNWLSVCLVWLKDDGRLCVNVPLDKNKGGQQSVGADITNIAKRLGYKYHSTIIWNEGNISRRTAWGSWMSASAPFVIAPVELIVVFYKNEWKKQRQNGTSDISREEFLSWTNGLWSFSGESAKKIGHPAPYPIELPRRCIKLFSFVEDIVLDPFLGSGSTIVAAHKNDRVCVGIEIDESYCKLSKDRLVSEAHVLEGRLF